MSKTQRTTLMQLNYNEQIKAHPFGKGIGFVLLTTSVWQRIITDNISKIEEQLRKSKILDYDLTNLLTRKFLRLLRKLKKEDKFNEKTYSLICPSDYIPPEGSSINYTVTTRKHFQIFSKK